MPVSKSPMRLDGTTVYLHDRVFAQCESIVAAEAIFSAFTILGFTEEEYTNADDNRVSDPFYTSW